MKMFLCVLFQAGIKLEVLLALNLSCWLTDAHSLFRISNQVGQMGEGSCKDLDRSYSFQLFCGEYVSCMYLLLSAIHNEFNPMQALMKATISSTPTGS